VASGRHQAVAGIEHLPSIAANFPTSSSRLKRPAAAPGPVHKSLKQLVPVGAGFLDRPIPWWPPPLVTQMAELLRAVQAAL